MSTQEKYQYWVKSSQEDFSIAKNFLDSKHYHYTLFFCHLTLEKLLKSYIVLHTEQVPPFDHNLVRLAELAGFKLDPETMFLLTDITTFNIKGRYDDYKNAFYKKATAEYTEKYLLATEKLIIWFTENFQQK